MKKSENTFFETFAGEMVEILQDYDVTTQVQLSAEGELQEMRMPMTVTGFVMDCDDYFLYLSNDGMEVNQALPINTIKHIGIVQVKDEIDEALDEAEPPEGSSYN